MSRFTLRFTATDADIDELGHVNNAVWVRWMQDVAVSHWAAVATPDEIARHVWVVTRHEIDYRGNVRAGEQVTAETWVQDPPRGARFDRMMRFTGDDGRVKIDARTTWALIDRDSGRLMRVPAEMAARFMETTGA
ncbi:MULTISPECIES: acyl-CoA thioesterase [unclassified Sphingomonas]|jgi:acyl-CoA thioester hydrolase|uniref:acyl-CoA thioesterase n=1 Tax=unclassified Sphingomonas TaxID=196159 RepID=UPI00083444D2|nr:MULTISPECIES: acyl-CoA thioesterase [unclassified Sphingomonas]